MPTPAWADALYRRLSRETSSGQLVPEIDGLRCVAIAGVMLLHLAGYIALRHAERAGAPPPLAGAVDRAVHDVANVGYFGVQLFFGISGFILALPFAEADLARRPRPPLRRYFLRRVTRLEPPYVLNLLAWYAAQVLVKGGSAVGLLLPLLASVFYVHNIAYGEPSRINHVAWTLEIEVQFYILAPLLTLVFRLRRTALRRGLLLAAVLVLPAAQLALAPWAGEAVRRSLLWNLQFFLVGFLLADVYLVDWRKAPPVDGRWDLIGLAAWAALLAGLLTGREAVVACLAPAILVAYAAAFRGPRWRRLFRWRPVVIIGGMCYTIYLYHWMAYYALGRLTMRLYDPGRPYWANFLIQMVTLVPLALAACAVLFALFEKPFMRRGWVDDVLAWFGRRPAAAPPAKPVPAAAPAPPAPGPGGRR